MIKCYSASLLKSYLDCPFAFKCRYLDDIKIDINPEYFRFGSEFHSNIKELTSSDENIVKMVNSIKEFLRDKKITEFEKKYFKEIDNIPFFSIIDAECEDDEILEFKSASNYWYQKDLDNNFIQATLYQKITGKKLTYLVTNKKTFKTRVYEYPYTEQNWVKILEIIDNISKETIYPKCNRYYRCDYCKLYQEKI